MNDLRHELERASRLAPLDDFGPETFHQRRERKESRRRAIGLIVGLAIGVGVVGGAFAAMRTYHPSWQPAGGDLTIPIAGPGQFYVWSAARFDTPPGAWNEREVRWNVDGDGHLAYTAHGSPNQTAPEVVFRQGEGEVIPALDVSFHSFGYYDAAPIPSDPTAALEVLVERSAGGGASPGPHETPAANVPMSARDYDVFRAITDLAGIDSEAFLTTPAQVSVLMRVLEGMPGATVADATDPAGRPALRIAFTEGEWVRYIYVDPTTHILLATGGRGPDAFRYTDVLVWESGIADSLDGRITQRLIPPASPDDLTFFDELR